MHRLAHPKTLRSCRRKLALGLTAILPLTAAQLPTPSFAAASTWSIVGQPGDDVRFVRADDPSRQSNALTISGILQYDNEKSLAHKRFAVSLDPSAAMLLAAEGDDESTAEVLDLGATETDDAGKFTVQIPALRGIDNYVEEDGSVGLMFHSLDDDFELLWRAPVYLPRGGEQQATAAVVDDEVYGKVSSGPDETMRPGGPDGDVTDEGGELDLYAPVPDDSPTPVAASDLTLKGIDALTTATSSQDVSVQDVDSGTKAKACNKAMGNIPWDNYGWKKKGPVYREWIPVQRAQTGNRTTSSRAFPGTATIPGTTLAPIRSGAAA